MKQAIGITNLNHEVIVTFLNLLLADEYVLYTKTRTAHWNMDGSNYFELHVFLENQYNRLDEIIDDIADRIRSLGHFALGSLKDFLSVSQMFDNTQNFNNSGQIFKELIKDHERIISIIHHEIFPISAKFKDLDTADFLEVLMEKHQEMVWKLSRFFPRPGFKSTSHILSHKNQIAVRQK